MDADSRIRSPAERANRCLLALSVIFLFAAGAYSEFNGEAPLAIGNGATTEATPPTSISPADYGSSPASPSVMAKMESAHSSGQSQSYRIGAIEQRLLVLKGN